MASPPTPAEYQSYQEFAPSSSSLLSDEAPSSQPSAPPSIPAPAPAPAPTPSPPSYQPPAPASPTAQPPVPVILSPQGAPETPPHAQPPITPDQPKTNTPTKTIGMAVGPAVVVCVVAAVLLWLWWQKRRKNSHNNDSESDGHHGNSDLERAEVAIKKFSMDSTSQGRREFEAEVRIITRLRHRNLVQLHGWCDSRKGLLLVYELVAGGSLDKHIYDANRLFTWSERYKIIMGLGAALCYLHQEWEQCVVHGDIKPSNIMVDSSYNTKLGDFGLARLVDHGKAWKATTSVFGTAGYIDPEFVITGKPSTQSDVYSFGIVLLEIVCAKPPVVLLEDEPSFVLLKWVWNLYSQNSILDAADERLRGGGATIDEWQMERVLVVGLWCAHPDLRERPSIARAMNVLQSDDARLPDLSRQIYRSKCSQPPIDVAVGGYYSGVTDGTFSGNGVLTSDTTTTRSSGSFSSPRPTTMAVPLAVLLSLCYLLTLCNHIPFVTSVSFDLNFSDSTTSPCGATLQCDLDAFFRPGMIDLTKADRTGNINDSIGLIWYKPEAVPLWDKATGELASFTTSFSFQIMIDEMSTDYKPGDGMTFFLTQYPPAPRNQTYSGGGSLGVFHFLNPLPPQYRTVAVEFDIFQNPEWNDSEYQHVGIDVNSLQSVASTDVNNLTTGSTMRATVSYDNSTMLLLVDLNVNATLSYQVISTVDLRNVLPEEVAVGFSATTGFSAELHQVLSWSFTSTLQPRAPAPPPAYGPAPQSPPIPHTKTEPSKKLLVMILAPVVIACAVSGLILWLWMKKPRRKLRDEGATNGSDSEEKHEDGDELERGVIGPKRFQYRDLVDATGDFVEEGKLGRGGFGQVYRGLLRSDDHPDGVPVAIKVFSSDSSCQGRREFEAEVRIISQLRHRNLVRLLGWCDSRKGLLLVYELVPEGSLDKHIYNTERILTWPERFKIILGLGSALTYLHQEWEQCIVHGDIKPSNIMLDSSYNTKLGDFGLARLADHGTGPRTTNLIQGTAGYIDPDFVNTRQRSTQSDVYSFGVVLLEIVAGRQPVVHHEGVPSFMLLKWVWGLYRQNATVNAADERLQGNDELSDRQMERTLVVGLWCAHPEPGQRPSIVQAMHALQSEDVKLPELSLEMYMAPPPNLAMGGGYSGGYSSNFSSSLPSSVTSGTTRLLPIYIYPLQRKIPQKGLAFWIWYPMVVFCLPNWWERVAFVVASFFQIEPHLFPRLPRCHLRKVAPFVRDLCKKHGLPYAAASFWDANVLTWKTLRAAALQGRKATSGAAPKNLARAALPSSDTGGDNSAASHLLHRPSSASPPLDPWPAKPGGGRDGGGGAFLIRFGARRGELMWVAAVWLRRGEPERPHGETASLRKRVDAAADSISTGKERRRHGNGGMLAHTVKGLLR
uniref:Protein kinase domain-containing protein n=1 Tax=Leersia perrieri TaxID=77586 RepID=A0A0D9XCN5_9ORYZ